MEVDTGESPPQSAEPNPDESSSEPFDKLLDILIELDDDLTCPICGKIFQDVRATNCGHAFCAACIDEFLKTKKQCPTCKIEINDVFPNYMLANLIALRESVNDEQRPAQNDDERKKSVEEKVAKLNLEEVEALYSALLKKKRELESFSENIGNTLFKEFLKLILVLNKKRCQKEMKEFRLAQQDLEVINRTVYEEVDPFLIGLIENCDSRTKRSRDSDSPKPSTSGASRTSRLNPRASQSSETTEDSLRLPAELEDPAVPKKSFTSVSTMSSLKPQVSFDSETAEETFSEPLKPHISGGSVSIEDPPTSKASGDSETNEDVFKSQASVDSESMEVSSPCSDELSKTDDLSPDLIARIETLNRHLDELNKMYMLIHSKQSRESTSEDSVEVASDNYLDEFKETLCKVSNYSQFKTLARFVYLEAARDKKEIVSVEFDKDCDVFSVAGAFQTIAIFDYSTIISSPSPVQLQYPVTVIHLEQKTCSTAWSPYFKNLMAASDNKGIASIYDVETKQKTGHFEEHERCCWTVDFNKLDINQFASGSDDGTCKIWSINMGRSCTTIKPGPGVNVCSVKYNPTSRYNIALALGDQSVQYYDLRKLNAPINMFRGHQKTVFAVRWLNPDEIISASTDNEMKLWSISEDKCLRTFSDRINLHNFIGLCTNGDYIAAGNENNTLHLYNKRFSKPLISYTFDLSGTTHPLQIRPEDVKYYAEGAFVSAATWKTREKVIVTANSVSEIKILQLV